MHALDKQEYIVYNGYTMVRQRSQVDYLIQVHLLDTARHRLRNQNIDHRLPQKSSLEF